MSIRLFLSRQRSTPQFKHVLRRASSLLLVSALSSCSPVAESIFKTSRFASAKPGESQAPTADIEEGSATTSATPLWLTDFTYETALVDATSSSDITSDGDLNLSRRNISSPIASPSPSPSASHSSDSLKQKVELELNDDEIDSFRENGKVEVALPALGSAWKLVRVIARFHVIQSELELIEADEAFETNATIQRRGDQLLISLAIQGDLSRSETHSTLSRLVRVELSLESHPIQTGVAESSSGGTSSPSPKNE